MEELNHIIWTIDITINESIPEIMVYTQDPSLICHNYFELRHFIQSIADRCYYLIDKSATISELPIQFRNFMGQFIPAFLSWSQELLFRLRSKFIDVLLSQMTNLLQLQYATFITYTISGYDIRPFIKTHLTEPKIKAIKDYIETINVSPCHSAEHYKFVNDNFEETLVWMRECDVKIEQEINTNPKTVSSDFNGACTIFNDVMEAIKFEN